MLQAGQFPVEAQVEEQSTRCHDTVLPIPLAVAPHFLGQQKLVHMVIVGTGHHQVCAEETGVGLHTHCTAA